MLHALLFPLPMQLSSGDPHQLVPHKYNTMCARKRLSHYLDPANAIPLCLYSYLLEVLLNDISCYLYSGLLQVLPNDISCYLYLDLLEVLANDISCYL